MVSNNYKFTKTHTQIAKGVAITLMMIHHLFAFPDRIQNVSYISILHFEEIPIEYLLGDFGKICVAMYLFLSGYGLYISSSKREHFTFKDSLRKMIKFLTNYWVVFMIFVPIGLIWFNDQTNYKFNALIFIKNFFTLSYSYNFEWWFVRLYLELLLLFPIVKIMLKRSIKSSLLISLSLYIIAFGMEVITKIVPTLSFLSKNILFADIQSILFWQLTFCIGCLFAKFNLFEYINISLFNKKVYKKTYYIVIILIVIVVRIGFTYVFQYIGVGNSSYVDFILTPIFILVCTNLIYINKIKASGTSPNNIMPNVIRSKSESLFKVLGRHSTNMWLTHTFFCFYYFQKLVFFPRLSILILIWLALLSVTTSIVIDVIIKGASIVIHKKGGSLLWR